MYGRFDGDLDWSLKVGSQWTQSSNSYGSGLSGSVGASAHYYSLFGVTLDYADGWDDRTGPGRSASLGIELRPLFLPRFVLDRQRGPAWLDLTIDSLAVGFGGYFSGGTEQLEASHGVWLSAGAGVPVASAASGPWLEARYTLRASEWSTGTEATRHQILLYLSWHGFASLLAR